MLVKSVRLHSGLKTPHAGVYIAASYQHMAKLTQDIFAIMLLLEF